MAKNSIKIVFLVAQIANVLLMVNAFPHTNEMKASEIQSCNKYSNSVDSELAFIKNQIVKELFAGMPAAQMKIILDTLGCKALADCQVLLDISSISYTVTNTLWTKHYVGRGDQANKQLLESFNVTVINNSTSIRDLTTSMKDYTVNQVFEVNINKTGHLISGTQNISIPFTANTPLSFIFNKSDVVSAKQTQPLVFKEAARNVTMNPFTEMNVTYNIFQFDEFNHYIMDFNVDKSMISHPSVNGNNVQFGKTNLLEFFKLHPKLLESLKFENPTGITLGNSTSGKGLSLKNFPAVEKITNFAVETVYSKVESIPGSPTKPPMTTTTFRPKYKTTTTSKPHF